MSDIDIFASRPTEAQPSFIDLAHVPDLGFQSNTGDNFVQSEVLSLVCLSRGFNSK